MAGQNSKCVDVTPNFVGLLVFVIGIFPHTYANNGPDQRPHKLRSFFILMATSKLQEYTTKKIYYLFPHCSIKENYRPEWLHSHDTGRLELDIFIEDLKIAIEIQGQQHYTFTPYFHKSYNDYQDQLYRDKVKKTVCNIEGIKLFEVGSKIDVDLLVEKLKEEILNVYALPSSTPHEIILKEYKALRSCRNNIKRDARKLKLSDRQISKKLDKFDKKHEYRKIQQMAKNLDLP